VKLRDTIFFQHPWVVCSDPTPDDQVVLFNVTTRRKDSDLNCIIKPGEHRFIKTESVIEYERGRLFSRDNWNKAVALRLPIYEPVSQALLLKIHQGALSSDLTPQKLQAIIRIALAS
jgi:hypothetical protein